MKKKDIGFIIACSCLIIGIAIGLYFILRTENTELMVKQDKDTYLDSSIDVLDKEISNEIIVKEETTINKGKKSEANNIPTSNKVTSDEEVIAFFNTLNKDLDNNSEDIRKKIKDNFVIGVDFLFYGGTIGGYTFNQLSDSAKLQVLELMMFVDEKIDTVLPGYKETITKTTGRIYNNVKTMVVESYINVTDKICSSNAKLCEDAKQGLEDMQYAFGLTWNFITNIASKGTAKLSSWYLEWKER